MAARPGTAAERSSWIREPERAGRYGLGARLSDMLHGWLDGRRGIPALPSRPDTADGAADASGNEDVADRHGRGGEAGAGQPSAPDETASARPAGPARPSLVSTQRIKVLSSLAGEQVALEEARLIEDRSRLEREAMPFLAARDALTDELALAEARRLQAADPLTDGQRGDRRLAERDVKARPDTLIQSRRHEAWQRRLGTAEQQHKSVLTRFAEADRQARLRDDLIRGRIELAQANARRHYEVALRRIATYAQQLVRTHPQGVELNQLLLSHPVGPDLPAWVDDPNAGVKDSAGPDDGPAGHADEPKPMDRRVSA
jgi:hypothetical protein